MSTEKPHILVVDDELLNRQILEDYLEIFGYSSHSVDNGADAIAYALSTPCDLVLLDIMMPFMDGMETATKLRNTFSHAELPIIMVTALSSRQDRLQAVEAGANDFVVKPVDRTELKVRVTSQLKIKQMQDEVKDYQRNLEFLIEERTKELRKALEETEQARSKIMQAHMDTIYRLGVAAEYKDEDTADHIYRMSHYCKVIAEGLKLDQTEIDLIFHSSPMHDVGKIGIPDAILFKPGKLSGEEWDVMKQHTSIGHRILASSDSKLLTAGSVIALAHHEKWDGSGYPAGLSGESIPLTGRICALADVFDALTSKRPYKEPFSVEKSLAIIEDGRGSHFDPQVYDAFMDKMDEILEIKLRFSE